MRATLMFRVGRTDEHLPWSGITHLVEHLALFQLGPQQRYEFNGAVTSNRTLFYATGAPAEIVSFLALVTTALGNLPLDRVETEKTVLLAEASSRSMSASDFMFSLRFGTRGNGLHRYREFGLHHVPAASRVPLLRECRRAISTWPCPPASGCRSRRSKHWPSRCRRTRKRRSEGQACRWWLRAPRRCSWLPTSPRRAC